VLADRLARTLEVLDPPKQWGHGAAARAVRTGLVSWRMQALCRAIVWAVHGVLFRCVEGGARDPDLEAEFLGQCMFFFFFFF
jgi:hypothetical protein